MTQVMLALAEIVRELVHTPPSACPHCNGLGVVVRETSSGRLYEWPCVAECPAPVVSIMVNRRHS